MNGQEHTDDIVLTEFGTQKTTICTDNNDEVGTNEVVEAPEPFTKETYLRVLSAGLSFFCAGVNDGSLGPLIPYILRSYNISTNLVSIVYGTTFAGWLMTALTNSHVCQYLDLGAMLVLGAALQLLAQILRVWLPPFPLYAITFFIQSWGMAFQDTHSNTYVTSVKGAHRWLAFIHAMYALGLTVGPFISTAIASSDTPSRWNLFYTFPIVIGTINLAFVLIAFRDLVRIKPTRTRTSSIVDAQPARSKNSNAIVELRTTLSTPGVWLLSLFFFFFLGTAITAGGWVVEYLVVVRGGDLGDMGYVPAGFSGGSFLGRLLLAEPTKRLGERRMIFIYAVICLAMELIFWLVPNIIAGVVSITIFGFFLGPFFATGVSVGSQIFPASIKSSALAFVFVLGQIGGSIFPAITGVIAAKSGVKVLQPMLVGLCTATAVSWLLVPKPNLHKD